MSLKGRSFISARDFSKEEYMEVFKLAKQMEEGKYKKRFPEKVLATAFFKPSVRTLLLTQAAMLKLGGSYVNLLESMTKGESFEELAETLGNFADVIAIRHGDENVATRASKLVKVPIIDCGSGDKEHVSSAFVYPYTVFRRLGKISGLKILFYGQTKYSRCVKSTAVALAKLGNSIYYDVPQGLGFPDWVVDSIKETGVEFKAVKIDDVIGEIDALCPEVETHLKKFPEEEYARIKSFYKPVTPVLVDKMKEKSVVFTPLPHTWELAPETLKHPKVAYYEVIKQGFFIQMAILASVL